MSTPPPTPAPSTPPPPLSREAPAHASLGVAPYRLGLLEHTYPLIWPLALRALGMGLRPTRIAMAYVLVVAMLVLAHAASALMPSRSVGAIETPAMVATDALREAYASLDARHAPRAALQFVATPIIVARQFPRVALLLSLPVALLVGVLGGCVVRSACVEFATGKRDPWPVSMGQTITHAKSLVLVLLGPIVLIGMLLAGASAFAWPASIGALGAGAGVLFGVVLLLAFLAMLLLVLWTMSLPLLLAAAVCEGEGALDATQRAFAYVASHPLRVAGYYAMLAAMAVLAMSVAGLLVLGTLTLGAWSASNVLEPSLASSITQTLLPAWRAEMGDAAEPSAMLRILAFWRTAGLLLVPAVLVSSLCTGSGAIYLLLRQGIDGRDRRIVWHRRDASPASPAFLQALSDSDDRESDA